MDWHSRKEEYPAVVVHDGRPLSTKRSNVQVLPLNTSGGPDQAKEIQIAAWETPVNGVPMRCIVRIDGHIQNARNADDDAYGWPCAVAKVSYTIGGYNRVTYVDAVGQSAFPVWAESIQVSTVWDRTRIDALAEFYANASESANDPGIAKEQHIAAAISVQTGDYGVGTARYFEVDTWGNEVAAATSVYKIPNAARQVRISNTWQITTGNPILLASDQLTGIAFTVGGIGYAAAAVVQRIPVADYELIHIPAGADIMVLGWTQNAAKDNGGPFLVEWTLRAD